MKGYEETSQWKKKQINKSKMERKKERKKECKLPVKTKTKKNENIWGNLPMKKETNKQK